MLHATARFHHPRHAGERADPKVDGELTPVFDLLVSGLRARG